MKVPKYKVDRDFATIVAARYGNDLVNFIKLIGEMLGDNIGSYPGSPYTPVALTGFGTTLYTLYWAWFTDKGNKTKRDALVAGMLVVVGYLDVMANFTDEIAEGNKILVELIGFDSVTGSSTRLAKPTPALNSLLYSMKSVAQKLFYSQTAKKDIKATIVISSISEGLTVTSPNDNQIELAITPVFKGNIILNFFTGSKGEIILTGLSGEELSSTTFGLNAAGLSPRVTPAPVTIP